jgi:ribosomal protein S26
MTRKKATKKKARVARCEQCRKRPPLEESIRKARVDDIIDGPYLQLPKRICSECLEAIAEEIWNYSLD